MKIIGDISKKEVEKILNKLVTSNKKATTDYDKTPEKVINFFMGQIMKETDGKADSEVVREIVINKLRNVQC